MNGANIGWAEFLLAVAIGSGGGWVLGRMPLHTELAQLTATHATERATAASAAAQAMAQAHARGDSLSAGLLNQQNNINQLKAEKTHAILQATTGNPCLFEPALRLLNTAPGLTVAGLPSTPASAAAAGGATDAVGGVNSWASTDTDISLWAIDTGAAYEVCRARLDALISWHATPTHTPPAAP